MLYCEMSFLGILIFFFCLALNLEIYVIILKISLIYLIVLLLLLLLFNLRGILVFLFNNFYSHVMRIFYS